MVAKPVIHSAGPSDSVLDIIGRAGGMREGAAQRVVFFPAETNIDAMNRGSSSYQKVACADEPNGRNDAFGEWRNCRTPSPSLAGSAPTSDTLEVPKQTSRTKGSTIVIDLAKPAFAGCLDIPAHREM